MAGPNNQLRMFPFFSVVDVGQQASPEDFFPTQLEGVRVNEEGKAKEIILYNNKLRGPIPNAFTGLGSLTLLNISGNARYFMFTIVAS